MAVRRPVSRERVLEAAVRLADAEGLAAVTMRRLAADLGIEAMSLYHHLPGKEAVLDGLLEPVLAEVAVEVERVVGPGGEPEPGRRTTATRPDGDWRAEVRARCLAARAVMLRHPWAPGLISSRPSVPLGAYQHYEAIAAAMSRGGLSHALVHKGMHALGGFALGFAPEIFSPDPTGGGLDQEAAEAEFAAIARLVPHLAAMAESEMHAATDPVLGWCDSQTEFEFTLDLVLDGLEAHRAS